MTKIQFFFYFSNSRQLIYDQQQKKNLFFSQQKSVTNFIKIDIIYFHIICVYVDTLICIYEIWRQKKREKKNPLKNENFFDMSHMGPMLSISKIMSLWKIRKKINKNKNKKRMHKRFKERYWKIYRAIKIYQKFFFYPKHENLFFYFFYTRLEIYAWNGNFIMKCFIFRNAEIVVWNFGYSGL